CARYAAQPEPRIPSDHRDDHPQPGGRKADGSNHRDARWPRRRSEDSRRRNQVMKLLFTTLKKTLFWSYERGSWQYDVMCVLILAFIFFAPGTFFHKPITVRSEEIGATGPVSQVEQQIADYLAHRYGHPVAISYIKRDEEPSGEVKYL